MIYSIINNPDLEATIDSCSPLAKSNLDELKKCLKGGSQRTHFEKHLAQIRSTVAFHYDSTLIKRALQDRVRRGNIQSRITWDNSIGYSRFEFADDIVDTIVCREIFKVQSGNIQTEVDKMMQWSFDKAKSYIEFGAEFIHKYVSEHNLS